MDSSPIRKPRRRWGRMFLQQALITLGLLLALEGLFSYCTAWRKINWGARADLRPTAESIHTDFDPLLGWISKPGFYDNLYGEGRDLTIAPNGERTFNTPPRAEHVLQAIASGDSFTMGYGVDDADRFRGAKGHYTEFGNKVMAKALLRELVRIGVVPAPPTRTSAAATQ